MQEPPVLFIFPGYRHKTYLNGSTGSNRALTPGVSREKAIDMKCYVCAKEGKESDAVAVCIVCGMGTCMKHTIRKEIEIWEGGYPFPSRKLNRSVPRMLCPDCSETYDTGKES